MLKHTLLIILVIIIAACGKKEDKTEEINLDKPVIIDTTTKNDTIEADFNEYSLPDEDKNTQNNSEPKNYELQLMSLTDHNRALKQIEIFTNLGYPAKITEFYKNGQLFYRIRLKDRFTKAEAQEIGENLKNEMPSLKNYWIIKVK